MHAMQLAIGMGLDIDQIDPLVGQYAADITQQTRAVAGRDLDTCLKHRVSTLAPFHLDQTVALVLGQSTHVRAVPLVNGYPGTHGDEADDIIPRHRLAATGDLGQQIADTVDHDIVLATLSTPLRFPQLAQRVVLHIEALQIANVSTSTSCPVLRL